MKIPTFSDVNDFEYSIILGESRFFLRFRFLERHSAWYMDCRTSEDVLLFEGRRLSPGTSPSFGVDSYVLGGSFFVSGPDPYTRESLGAELELSFFTNEEIDASRVSEPAFRLKITEGATALVPVVYASSAVVSVLEKRSVASYLLWDSKAAAYGEDDSFTLDGTSYFTEEWYAMPSVGTSGDKLVPNTGGSGVDPDAPAPAIEFLSMPELASYPAVYFPSGSDGLWINIDSDFIPVGSGFTLLVAFAVLQSDTETVIADMNELKSGSGDGVGIGMNSDGEIYFSVNGTIMTEVAPARTPGAVRVAAIVYDGEEEEATAYMDGVSVDTAAGAVDVSESGLGLGAYSDGTDAGGFIEGKAVLLLLCPYAMNARDLREIQWGLSSRSGAKRPD